MRIRALLGIVAAVAAGALVQSGLAASHPGAVPQPAGPPSPRGSVAVFNANGRHAPVKVTVASGPRTPTRVAATFLAQSRPAAARSLVPSRTTRLDAGHTVVRFAERHDGVPVIGGEAVVVLDRSLSVVAASSEVLPDPPPSTTPALTAAQAQQQAIAAVARASGRPGLTAAGATLTIFDPRLVSAPGIQRPALVWDVTVRRVAPRPVARRVLVDAQLGSVALQTEADQAALDRRVCDAASTAGQVPCTSPVRVEGGAASAVGDVNLAYQYAGDTYAFFAGLGRDSVDGHGLPLKSTVRFCPSVAECPYQNAYWDGAQMVYGAGFAAADDVVGHELTHGVTQYSSGLFYYSQSGAINESLSDVFGEFIDLGNGAGTDTPAVRWLIGEDIPAIGAIRNMKNPPAFGDPDSTASANYTADPNETDSGGVHTNSNVDNKAAYLLTDGATFNGTTVSGIGTTKAAKVYYAASQLLRSGSDYRDLADALDQACSTLTTSGQTTTSDCTQVTAATTATAMRQTPVNAPTTTAPVCGIGETATDVLRDTFSAGPSSAWTRTAASGANHWYWASESNPLGFDAHYSTVGANNLWGDDQDTASDTAIAMTASVTVPAAGAHLWLRHAFGFEHSPTSAYDGGVLEYSTNGGGSWTDAGPLMTEGGYSGTIAAGNGNPLQNRAAFVRQSNGYGSTRLDLSSLAGQQVRFRLRIGTDASVGDYGWFVDEVRIYGCAGMDVTPPDTTITAAPPARTASAAPSFSFTATEAGSTFECRMDSGAWGACTSPKSYAGLADGAHAFSVRATDAAANTDASPAQAAFTVDTTGPDTSITQAPPPLTASAVQIAFASPEIGATFECRLDAAAFSACTSPWSSGPLSDGPHTFTVRARDDLGNPDPTPAAATWTLDTTPPNTTITSAPPATTADSTPTFQFTATEAGSAFQCQVDAGAFSACASPFTSPTLADGTHTFSVRATDPAGNTDQSAAQAAFTVDTTLPDVTPPDTTITSAPPARIASTSPSFSFTATEAGSTFECRMDGGAFSACASPFTSPALTDGAHTFSVRATDPAANTDPTPAQAAFTVDTTGPDTSITQAPPPLTAAAVQISFASPEIGATFECRLDNAAFTACTSPWASVALSDGPHTFSVRALDDLGNPDPTPAGATWTLDTTVPPGVPLPPDPLPTPPGAEPFTFSTSPPVLTRTLAGVRVSTVVQCSAPCRPRLRVRLPGRLAAALGLHGARIGNDVVVAISQPRLTYSDSAVKVAVTLPGRLVRRGHATELLLTASAVDPAGRRAWVTVGHATVRPRRGP